MIDRQLPLPVPLHACPRHSSNAPLADREAARCSASTCAAPTKGSTSPRRAPASRNPTRTASASTHRLCVARTALRPAGASSGILAVRLRVPRCPSQRVHLRRHRLALLPERGVPAPCNRSVVRALISSAAPAQVRSTWPGRIRYRDDVLRDEGNAAFRKAAASGNYRKGEEVRCCSEVEG